MTEAEWDQRAGAALRRMVLARPQITLELEQRNAHSSATVTMVCQNEDQSENHYIHSTAYDPLGGVLAVALEDAARKVERLREGVTKEQFGEWVVKEAA